LVENFPGSIWPCRRVVRHAHSAGPRRLDGLADDQAGHGLAGVPGDQGADTRSPTLIVSIRLDNAKQLHDRRPFAGHADDA
jgi:hypothetical protein